MEGARMGFGLTGGWHGWGMGLGSQGGGRAGEWVFGVAGLGNGVWAHRGWQGWGIPGWSLLGGGLGAPGTGRGQGGGWGGHRESVGTDKVLLPQPLPLPRLDLSNCSLHDVPPGLAEATTAIVL